MISDSSYKQFQKYLPIILVVGVILLGGYLLLRKGIIKIPTNSSNKNAVSIGKTSVVDILFKGEEYKLKYTDMDPNLLVDIANFDKNEQWQGDGSIEDDVAQGIPVISLTDRDRQKAQTTLYKNINLDAVDDIKFSVSLKSDYEDVESLNFILSNKEGTSFYRFPITTLRPGLNYFTIPKYRFFLFSGESNETNTEITGALGGKKISWGTIEKLQFELISRPGSKVNVDIGWVRGEKEKIFSRDWNWDNSDQFLNLYHTADGKLALKVLQNGRAIGTLRQIGSVKDFTYSVKLAVFKEGFVGIFFRGDYKTGLGYHLTIGGLRTNDWILTKYYNDGTVVKSSQLLKGQLANFEFNEDQPFWLKVTVKGSNIIAYFSLDGANYTKLGEVTDDSLNSGGVGIVSSGGAAIIEDFYLSMK